MKKLGFIGLGIMGEMMAKRLLNNGFELVIYNRTKDKISKLDVSGFTIANSPSEVAKNCDVVISMLADSRAVEEVVFGTNGIFASIREGLIHIDMSTISPATTKKLYNEYKSHKSYFIHAPVLGSKTQAGDGTLLIFAGGDKEAIEKCEEIFKVLGKRLWIFDSVEKATNLKLAMNSMIATMIIALSQAFVLAEKSGISKETVLEVLENSALNSAMYQSKGKTIIDGNFAPNFYVKHILKDINLALETGQDLKVPLPILSAIRELYVSAISKGYENEDYSAVYKVIVEFAGLKI
ncbi:glyoxylate/succinic semialdehyde reductase [Candidatus Chrysopegis kryptomonas]|uniref:Glyoxylate/succinic semialdehyde reductase n=2 Tax=Candidatus Chryseopegocella kryptomonas TaxID=1633643 RepID=A0A0N7MWY1_9BACT|nr:glyoxylate/succinic semialdehyde reductase [Candidatus Chrysopegis kryptomonas]